MMMLWAWAGVPLGVYNIVEEFNIALRIQPQILIVLSLVTWIQCYYYEKNWSVSRSLALVVPVMCLMGGVQAALIFALRHAKEKDLEWPLILMAVLAAVLLAAGVGSHYVDIYLHRTVRGISFIFVAIDALGDVFSLLSVIFQPKLDILGIVIYGTELVLWMGIFTCGAYYNLVPWLKEKRLERSGSVAIEPQTGERATVNANTTSITLHDLPSSTSVFRTPSAEIEVHRQRSVSSRIGGVTHLPSRKNKLLVETTTPFVTWQAQTHNSSFPPHSASFPTTTKRLHSFAVASATNLVAGRICCPIIATSKHYPASMASQIYTLPNATSPGSQYSGSAPAYMVVPNPTPIAEAVDSEIVDPPPEIDFHAMTNTLATIAEALNESAEEAMLPTPPINTPVVTSPAASIVHRDYNARGRGMSTIGDKLARALAEGRKFHHDSDIMSTSDGSVRSSVPVDDESDSTSELLSERGNRNMRSVPIALGSPRVNPMGLISFTSNDLVDRPPLPFNSTDVIESTCPVRIGSGSMHPDSINSAATGVTEMSTWKEEVEGTFERALMCLENLARDEYKLDPSKPMGHYYEAHLKRMLGAHKRKYPAYVDLVDKS
ncbi:pq loop repeat protein [Stagonosporopsis vannaccii]|nr:pq loop repeat protein [Stagonosporopsis vannaccii]